MKYIIAFTVYGKDGIPRTFGEVVSSTNFGEIENIDHYNTVKEDTQKALEKKYPEAAIIRITGMLAIKG